MEIQTYEYNPRGDAANGQSGTLTSPSIQNRLMQQRPTSTSASSNPWAQAIQHTTQAANMIMRPFSPAMPAGQYDPNANRMGAGGYYQGPLSGSQPPSGQGGGGGVYSPPSGVGGGGQAAPPLNQNQPPSGVGGGGAGGGQAAPPMNPGPPPSGVQAQGGGISPQLQQRVDKYRSYNGFEWVTPEAVNAYTQAGMREGWIDTENAPHIAAWWAQNGYGPNSPGGPGAGGGGGAGGVGGGGAGGGGGIGGGGGVGGGGGIRVPMDPNTGLPRVPSSGGGGGFSGEQSPLLPGGTPGFDPNALGEGYLDFLKEKFGAQHGRERDQFAKDMRAQMALNNLQNSGAFVDVMGRGMADLTARQGQQIGDYIFRGGESAQDRLLQNEMSLRDQFMRKYLGDQSLQGTMYSADRGLDSARAGANATLGAANIRADVDRYLGGLDYDRGIYGIDAQREGNYLDNNYRMGGQMLDYLRFLYGTAPDNMIGNQGIPPGGVLVYGA